MNYKVGDISNGQARARLFPVVALSALLDASLWLRLRAGQGDRHDRRGDPALPEGGIANAGGYRVQLENSTFHYYSEAELRLAPDDKRQGG